MSLCQLSNISTNVLKPEQRKARHSHPLVMPGCVGVGVETPPPALVVVVEVVVLVVLTVVLRVVVALPLPPVVELPPPLDVDVGPGPSVGSSSNMGPVFVCCKRTHSHASTTNRLVQAVAEGLSPSWSRFRARSSDRVIPNCSAMERHVSPSTTIQELTQLVGVVTGG